MHLEIFSLTRLPFEFQYAYLDRFMTRTADKEFPDQRLTTRYATLRDCFSQEESIYLRMKSSKWTSVIHEAHEDRVQKCLAMKMALRAFQKSATADVKEAADELYKVVSEYKIRYGRGYEPMNTRFSNLVDDLSTDTLAPLVKKLCLETYVKAMMGDTDKIKKAIMSRNEDRKAAGRGALQKARRATEVAYRNFVEMLNSLQVTTPSAELDPLIELLNEDIHYYRATVLANKKSASDSDKQEDSKQEAQQDSNAAEQPDGDSTGEENSDQQEPAEATL
ncbi:MAG: hypothetical protein IJ244_01760 [Bacteroidaceae bacterium]|nr:hypothetical protein [Bacteroidaceae bacterium]